MKGKNKNKSSIKPAVFIAFIICLAVSGSFLYILRPDSETENPLFETIYASTSRLDSLIRRIDNLIYEALYEEDIREADIDFSDVIPRHKDNIDWDFTGLSVKVSDSKSADRLQSLIKNNLTESLPDVSVESELAPDNRFSLKIYALGYNTHRIVLDHTKKTVKKPKSLPKIAIIIDDIGYDYPLAVDFMDLKIPVSLSILPGAPFIKKIASGAEKRGCEVLLHLPMEPKGYPKFDPGPGAVLTSMDRETIHKVVKEDIEKVPGIKGVNHHMGSLFSEKIDKMKHVMDEIKKHDLFYVDSRTTNRSAAYKVARAIGVPAAEKSVFIDNDLTEKALRYQMERLLGIARSKGTAVGIAHPHRETLKILEKFSERFEKDFDVVPVSELVN